MAREQQRQTAEGVGMGSGSGSGQWAVGSGMAVAVAWAVAWHGMGSVQQTISIRHLSCHLPFLLNLGLSQSPVNEREICSVVFVLISVSSWTVFECRQIRSTKRHEQPQTR